MLQLLSYNCLLCIFGKQRPTSCIQRPSKAVLRVSHNYLITINHLLKHNNRSWDYLTIISQISYQDYVPDESHLGSLTVFWHIFADFWHFFDTFMILAVLLSFNYHFIVFWHIFDSFLTHLWHILENSGTSERHEYPNFHAKFIQVMVVCSWLFRLGVKQISAHSCRDVDRLMWYLSTIHFVRCFKRTFHKPYHCRCTKRNVRTHLCQVFSVDAWHA